MIKEDIKTAINRIYVDGTIRGIISEINNIDYDKETMSTISKVLDGISEKLNKLLEVK